MGIHFKIFNTFFVFLCKMFLLPLFLNLEYKNHVTYSWSIVMQYVGNSFFVRLTLLIQYIK